MPVEYLVQEEDGTSLFILEDASGAILLETSGIPVDAATDTGTISENASIRVASTDLAGISENTVLDQLSIGLHLAPVSTVTAGTWRTEIGGTNLHVSVDEPTANDSDYIYTVA